MAAVLAAALTAALTPLGGTQEGPGERHRVEIQGFQFVPERVVVAPGDTIVWVNRDSVPHTITAQDKRWDSQRLETNSAWELRVAEAMTGTYFCRYHPRMKGQVLVRRN